MVVVVYNKALAVTLMKPWTRAALLWTVLQAQNTPYANKARADLFHSRGTHIHHEP